jgi:GxxExxY protein
MPEQNDPLTEQVIACAIEVHKRLGPALLERTYHTAMGIELDFNKIPFESERTIEIEYRGRKIGHYRPDLIIKNELVVEIKSVSGYDEVFTAQMLTYLRVTGLRKGLLFNFNRELLKYGIRRFVL